jgi:hypothetical protein
MPVTFLTSVKLALAATAVLGAAALAVGLNVASPLDEPNDLLRTGAPGLAAKPCERQAWPAKACTKETVAAISEPAALQTSPAAAAPQPTDELRPEPVQDIAPEKTLASAAPQVGDARAEATPPGAGTPVPVAAAETAGTGNPTTQAALEGTGAEPPVVDPPPAVVPPSAAPQANVKKKPKRTARSRGIPPQWNRGPFMAGPYGFPFAYGGYPRSRAAVRQYPPAFFAFGR